MFLLMVLLVIIPIFVLLLKAIFYWNPKCVNRINVFNSKMFFNVYLRFGLEAYLELCLSSIIRFKNFTFETSSEKFHSVFALMILAGVIGLLVFSLIFL